jgi:UDP-N-acetyl-D-mannosaminuronate dehydrogenase
MNIKCNYEAKMNQLYTKIYHKCLEYNDNDAKGDEPVLKVLFLGLNMYPNITSLWNFDIWFLYKRFQKGHIEARIHDPIIRGSEALAGGVWLGRQSRDENWGHSYDVLILSCPHVWYITNIVKLSHLFKPEKRCMFLDLYGAFTRLNNLSDNIDIVNFKAEASEAELLGGLLPLNLPQLPPID